jgi:hypothetical protein
MPLVRITVRDDTSPDRQQAISTGVDAPDRMTWRKFRVLPDTPPPKGS